MASASLPLDLPARTAGSWDVSPDLLIGTDATREVLLVDVEGSRDCWWFAPARDTQLPEARLDVSVDGGCVTVTARAFVRDLALLVDKVDPAARVDSMMITLLPGESHTFRVDPPISVAGARRALTSVNHLVSAATPEKDSCWNSSTPRHEA